MLFQLHLNTHIYCFNLYLLYQDNCTTCERANPSQLRKVVDIALLGAKNDGKTLNTAIIQAAIDDCSISGGVTVYVAGGGKYLTGTLYMKSYVTLLYFPQYQRFGTENSNE